MAIQFTRVVSIKFYNQITKFEISFKSGEQMQ